MKVDRGKEIKVTATIIFASLTIIYGISVYTTMGSTLTISDGKPFLTPLPRNPLP